MKYKRADDQIQSAKLLLEEKKYKIILDLNNPTLAFAFITPLINILLNAAFRVIVVDATYNTNQLKYELYSIIGIIDSTGFPISYLYIANGKNRDIRMIITSWFKKIHELNINIETLLTNKDCTQISSARAIWKDINIQLYKWHVLRAIEQKLASTTKIMTVRYDSNAAHDECPFINATWQGNTLQQHTTQQESLRKEVLEYIELHFHHHMLIPTAKKEFVNSSKEIWLRAWYRWDRWNLWALSASSEVSVICMTMSIESHWHKETLWEKIRPTLINHAQDNLMIDLVNSKNENIYNEESSTED
ncbi:11493_t:CDS:2, partial [Gigaspora rosea]